MLCIGFNMKKPVFKKRNRFEKKGFKLKRKKKNGFDFSNRFQKTRKIPFFPVLFLKIFTK